MVENLPAMQETGFNPWVRKIPWRGHGNPLQYSCLENPMDRGAWRAIVDRITQNRTWLKWLTIQEMICHCFQFENLAYLIFILTYLIYHHQLWPVWLAKPPKNLWKGQECHLLLCMLCFFFFFKQLLQSGKIFLLFRLSLLK